jgi:CheY-like chemotaxis protein
MPVMDGYQASDKIRSLKNIQQPMIVACTGHSETEYIKKAFRHQMDEVLAKPANIEVVKCILLEIIDYKN